MVDAYEKHYGKLIGKKVVGLVKDSGKKDDPVSIGTVYGLRFSDNTVAWVLSDPEGNGPGFLDIEGV